MTDNDDYTPRTWGTFGMFTAEQATEMSQQIDENEEVTRTVEERLAIVEGYLAVFPVEKLANGFNTLHRIIPGGNMPMVSGRIQLEYFVAPETKNHTSITKITGSTPVSGTGPTVIRHGVYSVGTTGDLTRIAQTANDPTQFAVAFGENAKAFTAPCPIVASKIYATATLIVTAGTICTLRGTSGLGGGMLDDPPPLAKQVAGQADLPSFIPAASTQNLGSVYTYSRIWGG